MPLRCWSAVHDRALVALVVLVLVAVGAAGPAAAESLTCRRAILKTGAQFLHATAKALAKCEGAVVKGTLPGPCPDAKTAAAIDKATGKLASAIDKACGGADAVCGGDRTGEDTPADLGWPATCPNFTHGDCVNTISHCGGIATCLACTARSAAEQASALLYEDFALPSNGDLNTCQATIGKATTAFLAARSTALQKCWDARVRGKHGAACVPPAVGDGKYLGAIAKAEAKTVTAICKACGGADERCGTADDLSPAAIGFAAACPAVTVPGGDACAGPIGTLADLVACVGCVTSFQTGCMDRLALPGVTTYPSECNTCLAPMPSGPCPTALEFTADGPAVDLDTGWTGLAHQAKVPTNGRLTLAVAGCAGVSQPTCGTCSVSGPAENAGGAAFDNHRCADASWITCDDDVDCTNAGAAGPCSFFFGSPLPLVAGGIATCVVNRIAGPVTGTVDVETGASSTNVPLASSVYVGENSVSHPCPVCTAGTCGGGQRFAQPCVPQGTGEFGDVSLDCPPSNGTFYGTLSIPLAIGTGLQTRTVSMDHPRCNGGPEVASFRCLCDTCNNAAAEACSTNADCPPSGGNPGICGGRRCRSGVNAGAPCAVGSECPGGACNYLGEGTRPHACLDDTTTPLDGSRCHHVGGNEGECPEGPIQPYCSVETFRGCASDAECNPSSANGTCELCVPGQTCRARNRTCFTDNGIVGGSVDVTGTPDVPCGGVSYPTVGSFFCVAPVGATAVNTAGGLPGLGRIRLPGRVVVAP